jgi:Na+/melibiose symporter-like transporter
LWRSRNWRLLWAGQSVSVAGDYVFDVTVLLWVTRVIARHETWAPAAASGVLISAGIPALLVGPFAGVFVDRWDRRRTMLVADAARAMLIAGLIPLSLAPVAAHVPRAAQLALVYAVVAAAASFSQFFNPSRLAVLGAVVAKADLPKASGLLMSSMYTASIVAPPLATLLLFSAGIRWALIINAASFAMSFATIWLVRPGERMPAAGASAPGRGRYWREFGAGLRFFVTSRVLVAVLVGLCITVLGAAAINALNIFFLQVNLHTNASFYGLTGMAEGVGGVLGTLAAGWAIARAGAGRIFCAGLVLAGLAIVGYSRTSDLAAALALMAVIGVILGVVNTAGWPLVLTASPQQMIGRVRSVLTPAVYLASVCSTATAGLLASTALRGFRATVLGTTFGPYDTIIGVAGLLFVAAGLAAGPALRRVAAQPKPS